MKRWYLKWLVIATLVIGVLISAYVREQELEQNYEIGSLIVVSTELGLVEIVVDHEFIYIQPFEVANNNHIEPLTISSKQYPQLFKQGVAGMSFISAKLDEQDPTQLVIANNQPDHGGYSPVYWLVLNLKSGKLEE
jgi:hypothetical protein